EQPAQEARAVGEIILRQRALAEDLDLGRRTGAVAGDEVVSAIAVNIPDRHPHATREQGAVGEEVEQDGAALSAEDFHLRQAAGIAAHDEIGIAVAVKVATGHEEAAGEGDLEHEEVAQLHAAAAVEDLQLGKPAGAAASDQVRGAVAIDI